MSRMRGFGVQWPNTRPPLGRYERKRKRARPQQEAGSKAGSGAGGEERIPEPPAPAQAPAPLCVACDVILVGENSLESDGLCSRCLAMRSEP